MSAAVDALVTRGARQSPPGRIASFDWLRSLATAAVVLLHEFNMLLSTHEVAELGVPLYLAWTWLQIVLVRWAVPIFLMVSGALLLDPSRRMDWDKLARYLLRAACALALFCCIYSCVSAHGVSPQALVSGLVKALTQDSWDHLWYLYALMGLYLLTPILRAFVASASKRDQRLCLAVLAIPTLLVPTINEAAGLHVPNLVWVGSSFFYYLLGSYAQRHLDLTAPLALLGVVAVGAMLAVATWLIAGWQWYALWLMKPACPLTACWALLVFLLGKRYLAHTSLPAPLAWLSAHSLGIYLTHPVVLVVLYRRLWWLPYHPLPPVLFELVVYALALGVSAGFVTLLARVPGLQKLV